jgi:hypothetical protein
MCKWILLSALASCVAFSAPGEKVTFQYNFKTGEVIKSHLVVNSQMSMGKMEMTMDTSMHVDDAKPDGSASLTTQIDSGDMKMAGMKMAMPGRGKQFHMTVSKYGKRMDMGKDNSKVVVQEFPDHPVGVGDSWDGTVQVQGGRTSLDVKAHFTLDSINADDGHKLAHVLVVEDFENTDKGGMKVHASGWMDWDIDQGIPTAAHIEGTQAMGQMTSTFVSDQATKIDQ